MASAKTQAPLKYPDEPKRLFELSCTFDGPFNCDEAKNRLVALGALAVPVLLSKMDDAEHGWLAVQLLGRIGFPAAQAAIPELEKAMHQAKTEPGRAWPARILAQCGRFDLLEPLFESKKASVHFTLGEALKASRPQSYPLIERALNMKVATLTSAIASTLSPGSATFDVSIQMLPQMSVALHSQHAVLRRDAICALWHLESKGRTLCLPMIREALTDVDTDVRRLAVHGLAYTGRANREIAIELAKHMVNDKEKTVSDGATYTLRTLQERR
jgi:hypothetical protein